MSSGHSWASVVASGSTLIFTLCETQHNAVLVCLARKILHLVASISESQASCQKPVPENFETPVLVLGDKRYCYFLFTVQWIPIRTLVSLYSGFVIVFGTIGKGLYFLGVCVGIIFPIPLFWFAWTYYLFIHWIVTILASALWAWSFYILILMTYTYTEDSYKTYSASALAGIGLIRNVGGVDFPLFDTRYHMLGYQRATSLLAALSVLMMPIPFILGRYGMGWRSENGVYGRECTSKLERTMRAEKRWF
jgi:hypothetical protein